MLFEHSFESKRHAVLSATTLGKPVSGSNSGCVPTCA